MKRKHISRRMRNLVFEDAGGLCWVCRQAIDREKDRIEIAHKIALALGGLDDRSNMAPAHYACHRAETATVDIPQIAKAKRVEKKHNGTFRETRHIVPGSKASPYKKRLDGRVERRAPKVLDEAEAEADAADDLRRMCASWR